LPAALIIFSQGMKLGDTSSNLDPAAQMGFERSLEFRTLQHT